MNGKQSLKLHVRIKEAKNKPLTTTFPGLDGGGRTSNLQELTHGGRVRRLEDIRRGTLGFCHLEKIADSHWRPKPKKQSTLYEPYSKSENNFALVNIGRKGKEGNECFPSVLRMLQSPKPWGESRRNNQVRSLSTIPSLRSNPPEGKLKGLRSETTKSLSSISSSSRITPHRARYCLLPSQDSFLQDAVLHDKMASFGSHKEVYGSRASLVQPPGNASYTLTHMSSDNGIISVIKPPVTPVDRYLQNGEDGRATPAPHNEQLIMMRDNVSTPVVMSRLERILHPDLRIVQHRITSAASEVPTVGSEAPPDVNELLSDLGADHMRYLDDFVDVPVSPIAKDAWFAQSLEAQLTISSDTIGNLSHSTTIEMNFMFPKTVRMGKLLMPRSYNMEDPLDVAIFLEHLPNAFFTLTAKCELWLKTCPSAHHSLVP